MRRRDLLWAAAGTACTRAREPRPSNGANAGTDLFLPDPSDRRAFVDWFTYLAEAMYARPVGALPREVSDCAALLRFCFAESLRRHDQPWARELRLSRLPSAPPVQRFEYPRSTPNGARIFRVSGGEWSEFADARTLMHHNTRFRTRRCEEAEPGDLFFFEQAANRLPFHAMIYLGPSRWSAGPGPFVVYHTGPTGNQPGEMRRPALAQLLRHPEPEWRPQEGNRNFLGVYRWNLISEES